MNMLIGAFITALVQVGEVVDVSTAVGFKPKDLNEITLYLNEIDNRLTPVIVIDHFYLNDGQYEYKDPAPIKKAIADSGHIGRIVFMFDEIQWKGRLAGQDAHEILSLMRDIKKDFYGVEFAHIEAFTELYFQIMHYGALHMFYEAEHLGFDCYGEFQSCGGFGVPELPQLLYLTEIYKHALAAGSDAKLFLVPGAFASEGFFNDNSAILDQLQAYDNLINTYPDFVSGVGVFSWGSFDQIKGAREVPEVAEAVQNFLLKAKSFQ